MTSSQTIKVSRSQASIMACVVSALLELQTGASDNQQGVYMGAVKRIRSIVALRKYVYSETYPQVLREMWLLEDALAAAGEREQAEEVKQSVFLRLEKYIEDVPLDSV